jgi:hypothetical protein
MRWIFVGFAVVSFAVAAAASSCSIHRKSELFECETTADCDPGRTCSEGLCVVPGGPLPIDAGMSDASQACPSQCTACAPGKVCVIDCALTSACNSLVVCPTGFNCDIRCSQQNSCFAGINCLGAASCLIQCTGRSSCRGVTCGTGRCTLNCTGQTSCEGVSCGNSCACDVKCTVGNGSCNNVTCTRNECDTGRGCSATTFPSCNTCP